MYGKVLVNLNIRRTPSTQYAAIGQLAPNDIVQADSNVNGWWHLTAWTRSGAAMTLPGPDCYAYEGATNGFIAPVAPPEPAEEVYLDLAGWEDEQPAWEAANRAWIDQWRGRETDLNAIRVR